MSDSRKPTVTQLAVIRYFDGGAVPTVRTTEATREACRRNGWIERIETFPFHRTTDAGRAAIRTPQP